jgi:PAS domain S-box-containing protein
MNQTAKAIRPDEKKSAESEEKFAIAFKCCPQPFTLSTLVEDRYLDVNDAFVEKTGWAREEAIGRTTVELRIWETHAEREKLVERIVRGEPISNIECRFRRKNGEIFTALLSAELIELGGVQCVVANAIEITDWKRTQDALVASERTLRELNAKLVNAQEEERKRVARELHDDISQAMAVISVELSQLARSPMSAEDSAKVARIRNEVQQLALEVSHISHSLHPAKLQYLGISRALQGLCRDVSDAHKLEIECQCENVRLSNEAELCLYRIAQEALQNTVKYSKASRAAVEFKANGEGVHLMVKDEGVGFDVAKVSQGLGLVSMRERVRTIGGSVEVHSRPNCGTAIVVHMPLSCLNSN